MKLLVVGSGAREHALVWKLSSERNVTELVCAPGNAGIGSLARCARVDAGDPADVLALAARESVDLTIIGPEQPLAEGVRDAFEAAGRLLVGPSRCAAQLESSKAFAKDFMARHGVPTARYAIFDDAAHALDAIGRDEFGLPVVVKADGLAAGKGVTVAPTREAAEQAVREAMVARRFGDAGVRLVLEEYLDGEEASFFALCDGRRAVPLPTAQDHKRAFDDDRGPNTGGMGAFAPSPLVDGPLHDRIMREIVEPVLAGVREEGFEYRGFLYVGLMLTRSGPQVIELNVRLGDPEAQVILPMIDRDLSPLLVAAAAGSLAGESCPIASEPHVGVVMASAGYPDRHETGKPITGLEAVEPETGALVFHAGTTRADGRLVTTGGRVLTVVGRGATYAEAAARAYEGVRRIAFDGAQFRTDIGKKAERGSTTDAHASSPHSGGV